jgi:predicted ferric reductase
VTILIAITPVILWQVALPVAWDTPKNIAENIGRLAGLAGMALFAWNVILSARLKIYNKLFLGLDNTYRAHHIIGTSAFILLLIHPVMITYRYFLSSPASAYEFIKPSLASPFRLIGTIALGLMMLLMIITLYINVKYEWFVMTQRLLGLVLFIGGVHAVFVGGSSLKGGVMSLTIYFALLLALAATVYIYRSLFHGSFHKYFDYSIAKVVQRGNGIYDLVLSPKSKQIEFKPGQFAFIKLMTGGLLGQVHPFSMSSSPSDKLLSFGIKDLGEYTKKLGEVSEGVQVKVDGPYGTFSNQIVKNPRQVWIAGGIGITPFLSMSAALDDSQQVDLYYSVKTSSEAVYLDDLKKLASQKSNFKVALFDTDKQGFINADYIFKNSPNLDSANFMICGPAGLMKALKKQLRDKGVPKSNINTEEFNLT